MIVTFTNPPPLARNCLWPALLAIVAAGGSWALACITPFAAFAAILAASERRATALATIGLIWLANQAVGMMLLGYPLDPHSLGWGVAIGGAALLATGAASSVAAARMPAWLRLPLAFIAAFAAYEGSLALVAAVTGELAAFAPATVAQLLALDAAWFAALVAIRQALALVGWHAARLRPVA